MDWGGWGPRVALDYDLGHNTVLHAGGSIATRLPNLWYENFLTAGLPFVFNAFATAQPGVPIPFHNTFVPQVLPNAYDVQGQLIFPNGRSEDAKPNTQLDLQRFQKDVAALTPGQQVQLPTASGIVANFRNGYIGSYRLGFDHTLGRFVASANYVATVGVHLPSVYSPNSYTGADPAFAPFTQFDSAGHPIGGYGSESLIASADNPWITPTEANGFTETPNYEQTRAWLQRLDDASPLIRMETFGRSPQGRDLLVVRD
jgi:hypothetical protein